MMSDAAHDLASETTGEAMPTESERRTHSILMGRGATAAVVTTAPVRHRPFMVTLLAIVAGILAALSAVHPRSAPIAG
jgi:hypothetical protein